MGDINKPEISIIIPIYNVEKYLSRCLGSVEKQTFKDFEVIMVDDGSTDGSAGIAKEFAKRDERFKFFSRENLGASKTRNFAMEQATGEYISFIDSDDYVSYNFLAVLYLAIKRSDADIAMCGFNIHYEQNAKNKSVKSLKAGEYSRDEALGYLLKDNEIRFFIWNKLWKTDLLKNNDIQFRDMYYEDILFCTKAFAQINKLVVVDKKAYYYSRRTKTFLESSMSDKRINDYIYTVEFLRKFLEENNLYDKYKDCFKVHANHVYWSLPILNIQASHSSKKKGCIKRIIDGRKQVKKYKP